VHEGRAVLVLEACLDHVLQQAGRFDVFHALRQQALADGEARELLALQHQHLAALLAQHRRGHRTGRAGADDQDLGTFHVFVAGRISGIHSSSHRCVLVARSGGKAEESE